MYSYGPTHMAVQKQDDQHEHTFSNYVRIRDVVLKTYLGRWTIGKSGERGSGISVLPARHDDDDDDEIYIYKESKSLGKEKGKKTKKQTSQRTTNIEKVLKKVRWARLKKKKLNESGFYHKASSESVAVRACVRVCVCVYACLWLSVCLYVCTYVLVVTSQKISEYIRISLQFLFTLKKLTHRINAYIESALHQGLMNMFCCPQ